MLAERELGNLRQFQNTTNNKKLECLKGELYFADLGDIDRSERDSEQRGRRPVIIIQNDIGNKFSPTVIVAVITSQINKSKLPTHVEIKASDYGLEKDSVILCEQVRTLDKKKLKWYIGKLSFNDMSKVDAALQISLDLQQKYQPIIENKVSQIIMIDGWIQTCLKENMELNNEILIKMLKDRLEQIEYLKRVCQRVGINIDEVYTRKMGAVSNESREVCNR